MPLEIRVAAPGEAAVVAEILSEAARWLRARGDPLWALEQVSLPRVAPDVERGQFFLAWSRGEAAGTLRLIESDPLIWPEAASDEAIYLHRLAVRRAHAGGAVSSALLAFAARHAAERGARFLRLDCEASRAGLRRVYERAGFCFHSRHAMPRITLARYQLELGPG